MNDTTIITNTMDIDTTDASAGQPRPQPTNTTSTQVKIHPLAIIGISDHQTRITTGGGKTSSPLPVHDPTNSNSSNVPIIGLLFGYQNGITVTIVDAEEIEYPSSSSSSGSGSGTSEKEKHENIKTKIELHQKVFPAHEVVGWYRVDLTQHYLAMNIKEDDNDDDDDMVLPTENDLMINNGWMKEYNESPIFVLMDGNERKTDNDTNDESMDHENCNNKSSSNSTFDADQGEEGEKDPKKKKNVEDARDKLDRDEQLPIAVYETMIVGGNGNGGSEGDGVSSATGTSGTGGGMVFINLDFELETFEPERIAVEKVFQTQPKNTTGGTVTTTTATATGAKSKSDEKCAATTSSTTGASSGTDKDASSTTTIVQQTQSEVQIKSLISSIEAMNTRIAVLLDFLQKTQSGEIPPNHALLRQVQSLINQLPLVMGKGIYASPKNDTATTSDSSASRVGDEEKVQNEKLAFEFDSEYNDMMIVSFLATIAKTTKAVLSYSEKFKLVSESKGKDHAKTRYDRFKDDL